MRLGEPIELDIDQSEHGLIRRAYYDRFVQAYRKWEQGRRDDRTDQWGRYMVARDVYLEFIYPDITERKKMRYNHIVRRSKRVMVDRE